MNKDVNTTKQVTKRQFQGIVLKDSKDKTATVEVITIKTHSKYKKQYKTSKKYHIHDEKGVAKEGDVVIFEETRPISKTKKWRLLNVVK